MKYVIGIDGGGTKTELAACDLAGKILCEKILRGSNLYVSPPEEVEQTLGVFCRDCAAALGGSPQALCMGAAGMNGKYTEGRLKKILLAVSGCDKVIVCHDAEISLKANFGREAGVSLTAGTGTICVGQNGAGGSFRVSGWGHLCSDEGSAYDIARRALVAAARAHDGMSGKTLLTQALLQRTKSRDFEQFVDKIYRVYTDKASLAALAPVVSDCAKRGDRAAARILKEAACALFEVCRALVKKAGLTKERFEVCFNGGVLKNNAAVREELSSRLCDRYDCRIREKTERSVFGALKIALEKSEEEKRK